MKEIVAYPSSIVPAGSALEPAREPIYVLSSMQVEVIHVISFVIVLSMIMGASWYSLYLARKPSKKVVATTNREKTVTVDGELSPF